MMSSREGKWPNRHLRAIKHILELLLVVYSLHEKRCYKSSRPPGDAPGGGLEKCVGSRPFPEKPRHTIRATDIVDYSALKLGQKNGNPGTDADLAYF